MKLTLPLVLSAAAITVLTACTNTVDNNTQNKEIIAPVAKKVPFEMSNHGHTRIDDY